MRILLSILSICCIAAWTFLIAAAVSSCTYNVSMAHTQGVADDVIDDTQRNTPDISNNLVVPASVL